ncbi:pyrroline-5-carboxylate reductase [Metabacillus herbersteinensis]|uniref:Pyrroline-5-carboxylate reductase n=1 Tax=Metabacillus herbersteinensis TaxID=283816 RepID=A0ABV6GCQ4_9BACI
MKKIGFLGAGSMAEAMISGLIKGGVMTPEQIIVTNRSNYDRLQELKNRYGIEITDNKEVFIQESSIVLLAMKPKDVSEGIGSIRSFVDRQLILSVLAGISIHTIEELFDKDIAVVRAMPNTSASIGKAATAIAASDRVNIGELKICQTLFEAIGICTVVTENQLDAVTGLSGSGPAYIYYLVEVLEKAALEVGIDELIARELILQTLSGASEMLRVTGKSPTLLRKEVTSQGGTTEAGLSVLKELQFEEAMIACVKRATERSVELRTLFAKSLVKSADN